MNNLRMVVMIFTWLAVTTMLTSCEETNAIEDDENVSGQIHTKLVGTWVYQYYNTMQNRFDHRTYFFNKDGTFENMDDGGQKYEFNGKYSVSGGKVYFTNCLYRSNNRPEEWKQRIDAVSEYEIGKNTEGQETLDIYSLCEFPDSFDKSYFELSLAKNMQGVNRFPRKRCTKPTC